MTSYLKQHFVLIILGIFSRIMPHPANFTLVGGMAIWLGNKGDNKGLVVPILSMLLADLYLGLDGLFMRLIVYSGFVLMFLCGKYIKNLWVSGLVASFVFFLITNIGVWATSTMYTKSLLGLGQCFYMALPFWRNSLIADILFSQIFRYLEVWLPQTKSSSYTIS